MKTRDDQLTELLESIQPISASEDFTATLLDRAASRSPNRFHGRLRRRIAAAAVLIVALGLALGAGLMRTNRSGDAEASSVKDLINQQRQIEAELSQLRRLASETAPVAYVAGDEHVDIVLDLRSLNDAAATTKPAVYRPKHD